MLDLYVYYLFNNASVFDKIIAAVVDVGRNDAVVAGFLNVSYRAKAAAAVYMNAVHVFSRRISEILVKADVFYREVRHISHSQAKSYGFFKVRFLMENLVTCEKLIRHPECLNKSGMITRDSGRRECRRRTIY